MQNTAATACGLILALLLPCACAGKSDRASGQASSVGGSVGGTGMTAGASSGGTTSMQAGGIDGGPAVRADGQARPASQRCIGPCQNEGMRPVPSARPKCPEVEPTSGQACADTNLECSYGDNPSAPCRRLYGCQQADAGLTWFLDPARQESYPCTSLPDGYCPATPPAQLSYCTVASYNTPCVYGTLLCYCDGFDVPVAAGTPAHWGCSGPPADLACPAALPNIGEGCSSQTQGTECDYAGGCLDPTSGNVFCYNGVWELGTPYTCIGK